MMSQYIEQSVGAFLEHQDRIREQMQNMMGVANPLTVMNRLADQNMAMWNMFKPGGRSADGAEEAPETAKPQPDTATKQTK
jgi:polyhydroxyalkanoate synthesis regulator protein